MGVNELYFVNVFSQTPSAPLTDDDSGSERHVNVLTQEALVNPSEISYAKPQVLGVCEITVR